MRWPDSGDVHCKNANDVFLTHGADVLRECIDHAEPYPETRSDEKANADSA